MQAAQQNRSAALKATDNGDGSWTLNTSSASAGPTSSISALNSSITNLAGGASFTGTSVDWTTYGSATITAYSSHASATDGFSIQQSMDGTNWFITDTFTVSATTKTSVNVPRQGQYIRVVYTNGATLTTTFQLQTFLNSFQSRPVSARPVDGMSINNDFDQAITVPTTYNGTTADLTRSIVNATNTTGTGIVAAGLIGQFDDVSPTAITENQFGNLRIASDRSLLVAVQNSFSHISTSTTTTVKSGAGTLKGVTVNTLGTVASTCTIYDNTTATGTIIAVINTLALGGSFTYDIKFSTGLTIVTTGTVAPDITVSFK